MREHNIILILMISVVAINANSIVIKEATETTTAAVAEVTLNSNNTVGNNDQANHKGIDSNITNVQAYDNSLKYFEEDLYDAVVFNRYDEAVNLTLSLYTSGYSNAVRNAVNRLMDRGYPQLFNYAYKVTSTGPWYISRDCFPWELRIHEDLIFVRIINHNFNMALKYGDGEDWDGDKIAYGDPNTDTRWKITWKFLPVWSDNRVYFHLRPINKRYFLKLGNVRDGDGDHAAYGSKNHDTNRHMWYLQPERHNGKLLFFIINREYNQLLKLGQFTDSDGDRKAYGHSKRDFNAEYFGWEIDVL